jgi:hypothetical protein
MANRSPGATYPMRNCFLRSRMYEALRRLRECLKPPYFKGSVGVNRKVADRKLLFRIYPPDLRKLRREDCNWVSGLTH